MKITRTLLIIAILGLVINLSASVRINSMSSYFSYLIEDVETDSELFPSHISDYKSRFIQYTNPGMKNIDYFFFGDEIYLSIIPIYDKFTWKVTFVVNSYNNDHSIYLSDNNAYNYYHYNYIRRSNKYNLSEIGYAAVVNQISYQISDNFKLGCFFEYDNLWQFGTNSRKRHMFYYEHEIVEDILENDFKYDQYSTGFNFSFGANFKTDITLRYSHENLEFWLIDIIQIENTQIDGSYESLYIDKYENNYDLSQRDELFGVAILIKDVDHKMRYFMKCDYVLQDFEDISFENNEDINYRDDWLDYYSKRDENIERTEERRLYLTQFGIGKTLEKDKWEFYNGLKIIGNYIETDRFEFSENTEITIYDTTFADTLIYSNSEEYKIKDWKVAIQIPIGISYQMNDMLNFHGGIGLQIIRQELDYLEEDNFKSWGTETDFNLGSSINPWEKLNIEINFNGGFTNFYRWHIDLKYLW